MVLTTLSATAHDKVANQAVTICCSAVGKNWSRDFGICHDNGVWGSKSATAHRMRHLEVFESIQPGQLGIAVHGFRWLDAANPPRNAKGAAYGPRAPEDVFPRACFADFFLFEVDGEPYRSTTPMWSDGPVDEWDLRLPLNPLYRAEGVELRMDEINPAVREGIRMSGIFASMPYVIAPARIGKPSDSTPGTAVLFPTTRVTDVLAKTFVRTEATLLRQRLLRGRAAAPCAFCGREALAEDLEVAHLKQRAACDEHERLDPDVAALACITCHHGFDAGAMFVDADGVLRVTAAAAQSEWRAELFGPLDGRPFAGWCREAEGYLAWHRERLREPRPLS